ncbi:MAG: ABC transporter ATP-binding protein [Chloroflexi bacterium]|nr:ABC transporter ATP-binding protein [Chloroflexota bacterium]
MNTLLEIKNLKINFKTFEGEKQALDIEHLQLGRGETLGLVGESGAGKTVLALAVLGLLPAGQSVIHSGEIRFDGEDLLQKSRRELEENYRGRRIAMIFQDPMSTLNPVFTVGQQLGNVIQRHRGLKGADLKNASIQTLELVRLSDAESALQKYPHELSGGQRQRVIIAIALSCGAELLIADEPTRNLDVTIQAGILKLMDELQKTLGLSVLFIANNMGLVNVICKHIGVLYRGKVVELGPSRAVIENHKHPYTEALISAIPREKSEKLKFAAASLRSETKRGCPYYARCPLAVESCLEQNPNLIPISDGHRAACILLREGGGR